MEYRPQVIHVNLDPELLLLLREVHYLQQPPFAVRLQDSVRDLLRHTDASALRTTAARLETIVAKYNAAMRSLVDFERPLFERKLGKIDHVSLVIRCCARPKSLSRKDVSDMNYF